MDRGPYHLCFSGRSFLGVYDVGTAVCLLDHGKGLINRVEGYGGISAGPIAAAFMMSAPERLLQYLDAILSLSVKIHSLPQGALTEGFDLIQELRNILDSQLKENCHTTCSTRLRVPLQELVPADGIPAEMRRRPETLEEEINPTRAPVKSDIVRVDGKDYLFGEKQVVTGYSGKKAFIEVLLAAVFYPSIPSTSAPVVEGKRYIDVSALSGTPRDGSDCGFPPTGHVITISPNKQAGCSKPRDNLTLGLRDVSRENYVSEPWHMFRMGAGLYPPTREELEKQFLDGVQDTKEFLIHKYRAYEDAQDSYPYRAPLY